MGGERSVGCRDALVFVDKLDENPPPRAALGNADPLSEGGQGSLGLSLFRKDDVSTSL